ncbi:MAG: tripartite tricarboxylate transporter substrate binding protein [Polynucleobacter sp.]|jgi:tripartite-type tricarboxylate transporter receptor subunit TctC|nr:tripartite tricarboxylate transporter substrate binding protein [Polynucleobacter sp.]
MKLYKYLLHGILVGIFIFSLTSHAQTNYPNRPIRLIIPFTPGGVTDTSGRYIAEQLSLKLGQQVIADNRPGASGNIGAQMVASAEPDGYTLLLGYAGTLSINPSLFDKIPFDSVKDFAPIGKIGDAILIVVANNDFQGKTLADVIAISKKDPNGLSYGTSGAGGTPHIAGELLKQKTGANLVHVPYKGGGQALIDLLGGNIPLVYTAVAGANQYVKSGRIKAIAVSSAKRSPSLPDVPTFTESGIKDFEIDDWVGLLAPAKTPKPILTKLNQALNEILNSPEGKARLLAMGITPTPGSPEKFGEQIKGDLIRFAPIVKGVQIKSE